MLQKVRYVPSSIDEKDYEEYVDKEDAKCYNAFVTSMVEAQDVLYKNAPFIKEEFYEMFIEILELCRKQNGEFSKMINNMYEPSTETELRRKAEAEVDDRTKDIKNKLDTLNVELRTYLSQLDVID